VNLEDEALRIGGRMLPQLIKWIGAKLAIGDKPEAELELLLDTSDLAIDFAERAKFGDDR
jgi:hypothetical protein